METGLLVVAEPLPVIEMNRNGVPLTLTTVPAGPEPLPRSTTPLSLMPSEPVTRHVPGRSRTAPRKPFTSGSAETRVRAARMAAVSSPPEGPRVSATGTAGSGTPPPPYPACEKSMILSPRLSMVRYDSLSSGPKKTHLLRGPSLSKRAAQVPPAAGIGVVVGVAVGGPFSVRAMCADVAKANRAAQRPMGARFRVPSDPSARSRRDR